MAHRLGQQALQQSIKHLCRYGDTDVLPHSPELAFFRDEEAAIVAELSALDLDSYDPSSAVEALAPKSKYGFRVCLESVSQRATLRRSMMAEAV
jgi:hypothetical protein